MGGSNIVCSKVSKTEKRFMYWPPCNKSLVSEFVIAKKLNIQSSRPRYKDSLLRFVKDCGPIAQKVAAKKLEGLNFQQLSNGNTRRLNISNGVINKDKNDSYQAFAAALMHISVYDAEFANGTIGNNSILNRNVVSKIDNVVNMIRQQNMPISGSSSPGVPIIVHPTCVISRPHENPFQSS